MKHVRQDQEGHRQCSFNKLFSGSATPEESLGRIRYAAAYEYLCKPSEPELAAHLATTTETLAAWKLRPEWHEALQAISKKMLSTSPGLRQAIQNLAKDESPETRREVVETVVDMAFSTNPFAKTIL